MFSSPPLSFLNLLSMPRSRKKLNKGYNCECIACLRVKEWLANAMDVNNCVTNDDMMTQFFLAWEMCHRSIIMLNFGTDVCVSLSVSNEPNEHVSVKLSVVCLDEERVDVGVRPCAFLLLIESMVKLITKKRNSLTCAQQVLFMSLTHFIYLRGDIVPHLYEETNPYLDLRRLKQVTDEFKAMTNDHEDHLASLVSILSNILVYFLMTIIMSDQRDETASKRLKQKKVREFREVEKEKIVLSMAQQDHVTPIFRFLRSMGLRHIIRDIRFILYKHNMKSEKCYSQECNERECATNKFMSCSQCGAKYCSRVCQKKDWRNHKAKCKAVPSYIFPTPDYLRNEIEET